MLDDVGSSVSFAHEREGVVQAAFGTYRDIGYAKPRQFPELLVAFAPHVFDAGEASDRVHHWHGGTDVLDCFAKALHRQAKGIASRQEDAVWFLPRRPRELLDVSANLVFGRDGERGPLEHCAEPALVVRASLSDLQHRLGLLEQRPPVRSFGIMHGNHPPLSIGSFAEHPPKIQ